METRLDTIYFHVTRRCNLKCIYCYLPAGYEDYNEITELEVQNILKSISFLQPRRVVITGGEPLLRKEIFKYIKIIRDSENGIKWCLNSNGTLINSENANEIVESFDDIRISIDSFKNINDQIRVGAGFNKVMKAFKLLIENGGKPTAFVTATSMNLPYLHDFMDYLLANNINDIHISHLKNIGLAQDNKLICDKESVLKIVNEYWEKRYGFQLKKERHPTKNCGVGRYINILPEGTVYPCHTLTFTDLCLGNIKEDKLENICTNSILLKKLKNANFEEISKKTISFSGLNKSGECLGDYLNSKEDIKSLISYLD